MEVLERDNLVKRLAPAGFTTESFAYLGADCDTFFKRTAYL